jgi:hypothetical protein
MFVHFITQSFLMVMFFCAEGEARRIGRCPFWVAPTASSFPRRLSVIVLRNAC